MDQKDVCGRMARWSLKLHGFDFTIKNRKDNVIVVPSTLSSGEVEELVTDSTVTYSFLNNGADESKTGDYHKTKNSIAENSSRLSDLMFKGELILKRTRFRSNLVSDKSPWQMLGYKAHDPPNEVYNGRRSQDRSQIVSHLLLDKISSQRQKIYIA